MSYVRYFSYMCVPLDPPAKSITEAIRRTKNHPTAKLYKELMGKELMKMKSFRELLERFAV